MEHEPLSQGIADVADLIDCVAQREAYRRATEFILTKGVDVTRDRIEVQIDGWLAPSEDRG